PDGKLLATGTDRLQAPGILLWDTATARRVPGPVEEPADVRSVAWSPNGESLAVITGGEQLIVWSTREWAVRTVAAGVSGHPAWRPGRPSGRGEIAAWDQHRRVGIWDTRTGRQTASLEPPGRADGLNQWFPFGFRDELAWRGDGNRLAALVGGGITVWDGAGRHLATLISPERS